MMMIPEPLKGDDRMNARTGRFTSITPASWSRGTARRPSPSPTACSIGTCSTATACGHTLLRNQGRPGHHGVRGRRAGIAAGKHGCARAGLQPGQMFLVDLEKGRIIADDEIKTRSPREKPFARIARREPRDARRLAQRALSLTSRTMPRFSCGSRRSAIRPKTGPSHGGGWQRGRRGDRLDGQRCRPRRPLRPTALLYNYFKQLFAQVTNPPVDCIREEIIMPMETTIGRSTICSTRRRIRASRTGCGRRSCSTTSWTTAAARGDDARPLQVEHAADPVQPPRKRPRPEAHDDNPVSMMPRPPSPRARSTSFFPTVPSMELSKRRRSRRAARHRGRPPSFDPWTAPATPGRASSWRAANPGVAVASPC